MAGDVIPSDSEESIVDASLRYAPFSMTDRWHPERSEESSAMWMLRFAQHDKRGNALRSA